jgi:hypothetical protein
VFKESIRFIVGFVFGALAVVFLSGCTTTRGVITDEYITASQVSVGRIEIANSIARTEIGWAAAEVTDIREHAGNIRDGIDRIEYLFGQYEAVVSRLIRSLTEIEQATRTGETESTDTWSNSNNPHLDYNSQVISRH